MLERKGGFWKDDGYSPLTLNNSRSIIYNAKSFLYHIPKHKSTYSVQIWHRWLFFCLLLIKLSIYSFPHPPTPFVLRYRSKNGQFEQHMQQGPFFISESTYGYIWRKRTIATYYPYTWSISSVISLTESLRTVRYTLAQAWTFNR